MDALKEQRRVRRSAATRTCNTIDSQITNMSISSLYQNVGYLNSLLAELKDLDSQIFIEMCSPQHKFTENDRDQEYDDC